MKARTKISWADFTLNPWEGCTKVSEGCKHCYAEARNTRYAEGRNWGPGAPRRKSKSALNDIATINRRFGPGGDLTLWEAPHTLERWIEGKEPAPALVAAPRRVKPQVFSLSLGDILDPEIDPAWLGEWIAAIAAATNLEFLLLTKRPELFFERMKAVEASHPVGDYTGALEQFTSTGFPHVAWGTSVESNKVRARMLDLAAIPAARRFLSCEPLCGPVELGMATSMSKIHLVITGGESGPQARPMHPNWIADIDAACRETGTAHHFKQWGAWAPAALVDLDDNQRNPGNRMWVGIDGKVEQYAADLIDHLPAAAMHRCLKPVAAKIQGNTQQPRLVFP